MDSTVGLLQIMPWLPIMALVMFRLTGFVLAAPLFSGSLLPVQLKAALVVMLAVLICPAVARTFPVNITLTQIVICGVGEVLIGLSIGVAVGLMLGSAEWAGLIVGQQGGFALGEVFNPTLEEQTSIIGQMYSMVFTLVFLAAGGHRAAIAALLDTFQRIPPMSFRLDETLMLLVLEMLTSAFTFALRLSGPVLVALFLSECALAVLSRAIPQLNILTIGFAVRAMLGIAVSAVVMTACGETLVDCLRQGNDLIRETFDLPATLRGQVN